MTGKRDYIDTLKTAADPLQVASALGLHVRGKRFFCPACQPSGGKSPDLVITDKGFICHKCGQKGDILKLIMVCKGIEFLQALAFLEELTGTRKQSGVSRNTRRPAIVDTGAFCAATGTVLSTRGAVRPELTKTPDPAVYAAFLSGCRPVEGCAMDWLKGKGCAPEIASALGLRFCGREYPGIMADLSNDFGEGALLAAGLLKRSKTGRSIPSFWHYFAKQAGFLVIPYLLDGRPVYLKTRPPVSKDKAERLQLARFLNTAAAVPCLYNVDALATQPDKVLICEGESDTWAALSAGVAAVGSPGAKNFKAAWVETFRAFVDASGRSRVFLVPDADAAGAEGSRIIAGLFLKAGLPVPLKLTIPDGKDLSELLSGDPRDAS